MLSQITSGIAGNMGDAIKMLNTVALSLGIASHGASAAEKPAYLSCHGKKKSMGGTPDLDGYISIFIEGANITVEPANEAIKLTARLVNDDDFVTFKHRPGEKASMIRA
jgi:hypothetical protein